MSIIRKIEARELFDSRGFPTVEAEVFLDTGYSGRALVPSGASTGSREALELRDGDPARLMGKGVKKAVENILNKLSPVLLGREIFAQEEIDRALIELDEPTKQKYGANAILALSLACAQAAAKAREQPLFSYLATLTNSQPCLPIPLLNILNGGAHADNSIDIQEFMVMPVGASHFVEAMQMGVEIYHCLKQVLKERKLNTNVGDEGGFAPDLPSNTAALDLLMLAIEKAGFKPGKEIFLALDVAASELYQEGKYHLASEKKQLTSTQFTLQLAQWVEHYPILSIEDGMDEGDWEGWQSLTQTLGKRVQLIGDDLFVTQVALFEKGIAAHLANAILIKPNQVGTLTETLAAIEIAKKSHYNAIISHRSGETEDTFIADLAVGTGVGQIKTGAPCRSDRTAKYNQLLRIASQLKQDINRTVFQRWGVE